MVEIYNNERTRETERENNKLGNGKKRRDRQIDRQGVTRLINVKNRGMNVKTTAFKSAKLKTHKRTDRERDGRSEINEAGRVCVCVSVCVCVCVRERERVFEVCRFNLRTG